EFCHAGWMLRFLTTKNLSSATEQIRLAVLSQFLPGYSFRSHYDREVPSLELPVSTHYGRVFTTILGTDRDYRAMCSRELQTSLVDQPNMNRVRGCGSSTRVKPRRTKDVSLCLEKAGFRIHP